MPDDIKPLTTTKPSTTTAPSCFVADTKIDTTIGRTSIADLARLSSQRDAHSQSSTHHCAMLASEAESRLADFDAKATAQLENANEAAFAAMQTALNAQRAALEQQFSGEIANAQQQASDMIASMLPNVLVYDPDSGSIVERAIVKAWEVRTTTALVDVTIDSVPFVDELGQPVELPIKIRCTPEHVFITPNGDVMADALTGQPIYHVDEQGVVSAYVVPSAVSVELAEPVAVYDIEVEGIASYCVSPSASCCSAVVHNSTYPGERLPVELVFSKAPPPTYETREITDPATGEKFDFDVPMPWSDQAATILATKYRRKTDVPRDAKPWRRPIGSIVPDTYDPNERAAAVDVGGETSARQIFGRLAGAWAHWGWELGYFTAVGAEIFRDELTAMLEQQVAAPNSPQWFNTGLHWAYGIKGRAQGHYAADFFRTEPHHMIAACEDAYSRPQVHACFIQGVSDNLIGDDGIMGLMAREARVFKFGGGSGSNYSELRGKNEPLAGGGKSSGMLSFVRVSDRSAGAIKSGGRTRRAARMVIVDVDHPDIEEFIGWKSHEEDKVRALRAAGIGDVNDFEDEATETVSGQNGNNSVRLTDAFMRAVRNDAPFDLIYRTTGAVAKTVRARDLWDQICEAAWKCADPGVQFHDTINAMNTCACDGQIRASNPCQPASALVLTQDGIRTFADVDVGSVIWSGKQWTKITRKVATGIKPVYEYRTCCGSFVGTQQHLVFESGSRIEAQHAKGIDQCPLPGDVDTKTSSLCTLTVDAVEYLGDMPVFDITVEADEHSYWTDGLLVSNCSEYMFLDETACNLASLNLVKFLRDDGSFDVDLYRHAVRLWTIVLDISVSMAGYPSEQIAERSMDYRTLGLGYANLGGMLMRLGIPYDSTRGHIVGAQVTSQLGAYSWQTSAELAQLLGPFPAFDRNRAPTLRTLESHLRQAQDNNAYGDEWKVAYDSVVEHGARNAQCTLLAPTGTIGLVMDCDSYGGEPVYALKQYKALAGGGHMEIVCAAAQAYALQGRRLRDGEAGVLDLTDPVLACANDIPWSGHLAMMAVQQPYLCGAISKTVNMPNGSTVADISDAYMQAWMLGLKAVALYRDGCKSTQVLTTDSSVKPEYVPLLDRTLTDTLPKSLLRGQREAPPGLRSGSTVGLKIAGESHYVTINRFPDGRVCEVFVNTGKAGGTVSGWANAFAVMLSHYLQNGGSLPAITDKLRYQRFEPAGFVSDAPCGITSATSPVDAIAQLLSALTSAEPPSVVVEPLSRPVTWSTSDLRAAATMVGKPVHVNAVCSHCRSTNMLAAGTCLTCGDCGETTGCG